MIFYLLIGVVLLVALYAIARWVAETDPKSVLSAAKWAAFILGGTLLGVALLKGWVGYLFGALFGILPVLWRWRGMIGLMGNIASRVRNARGPSQGQSSGISTRYLRMSLDHDTGAMDGEVLEGRYAGQMLSQLGESQVVDLLTETLEEDPQSAELLETYLDRTYGPNWRDAAEDQSATQQPRAPSSGPMTRSQALDILGLKDGATSDDVREAHRHLMRQHHPDRGGSSILAAQINQAKDVLLG